MHRSQRALLDDHEWLRRRYLSDQVSVRAIAAQVGCSTSTVRGALKAADAATRSRGRRRRLRAVDANQILRLVAAHGYIGAAQQLGIDPSTLYREVRRLGSAEKERAAIQAHRLGTSDGGLDG
jgi:transposase-like protein